EDRVVKRSRGGFSSGGKTGCDRGQRRGKVSTAREWVSFCWRLRNSGRGDRRFAGELATPLARSTRIRGRSLRFGKKSAQNPGRLNPLVLALQNDFRVLLVVRYGRLDESARAERAHEKNPGMGVGEETHRTHFRVRRFCRCD